jgi:serine phosphatase RsbU (regulator of sigma subunit)
MKALQTVLSRGPLARQSLRAGAALLIAARAHGPQDDDQTLVLARVR